MAIDITARYEKTHIIIRQIKRIKHKRTVSSDNHLFVVGKSSPDQIIRKLCHKLWIEGTLDIVNGEKTRGILTIEQRKIEKQEQESLVSTLLVEVMKRILQESVANRETVFICQKIIRDAETIKPVKEK